jgi:hypothetical protein
MTNNKFILAVISIMAGFFMTGLLSSILIPVIELSVANLPANTQETTTTVYMIALLATVVIFPIYIFRWLQKRTVAPEKEIPERERNPKIAFAGLAVLCFGILIYGFTMSTNRVDDLAYLIGRNTVLGLLWYVLYSGLLGKHLSASQKSISYAVILTSLILGAYIAADRQSQQENETLARIQENLDRVLEPTLNDDGRIEAIAVNPLASQSQDENIVMEAWGNDYMNKVIVNQNNYITEIEAIGYIKLLDGDRIRADSNLAESSFILNRTRAVIDKYEQLNTETAYAARDSIQSLNISESSKRELEGGFSGSIQDGLDSAQQIWNLERQIVSATEELVEFVNSVNANWEWDDEQFLFENAKTLEIFNSFIAEIQELTQEQALIRASNSQSTGSIIQ